MTGLILPAAQLPVLMVKVDKSKPVILLDHQPYHLAESEFAGVDLQFSGQYTPWTNMAYELGNRPYF